MSLDDSGVGAHTDREIVLTRLLDAPRELVFRVWTEPQHVAQWWGPNGFTNTIHQMDVRVDGNWRFIMHGPDGTDYPNRIVFKEIDAPRRIFYAHGDDDGGDAFTPSFHAEVTFIEEAGKTRLVLRLIFDSVEAAEKVKAFGAVEGGKQTLDRLAAHLQRLRG
ncbi:SRPBCC family protein [Uliginosibacterium sp. H1]|uniref:SRPBCC family protein n=1 Tax=Uliginosibacterium sp. H1 TaxID=3114757 RepID=UPI002E17DC43|nr:SRPBCC family protein [Uliginosibacterium sp. H1]